MNAHPGDHESWRDAVLDVWRAGQRLSAVGPGRVEAHLEHSIELAAQVAVPSRAVDLGSGAGLPGLALAGLWPESAWLLLDAARRRTRLLEDAVVQLGWSDRVAVVHGRAEDVARNPRWRGWADLVVARSFGPPAVTAECGAALLRPGGVLLVTEPPDAGSVRWPDGPLSELGLVARPSPATDRVRVQRLERIGELPERFPRRAGVPAKRPLF